MKVRSRKTRALKAAVLLPAVALAGVGLSACESKAGSAAVVNGDKISEKTVSSYLTPSAAMYTTSAGQVVIPRQLVVETLINERLYGELYAENGGKPSAAALAATDTQILQGTTKADIVRQSLASGYQPSFTDIRIHVVEMQALLQGRFGTQAALKTAVDKLKFSVSLSPRYGKWDPTQLGVTQLGKKTLPDMLTLDHNLPGDVTPSASQ